ncbi:hypothetical protein JHK84_038081 [Glycine max]|nr:hypothetical protein JHK85_038422 [Glycine max]KAG4978394.1 hypothetical protein JHK86_037868 [Glycine max]KAG5131684.1 hypothetical protein JHK84_038081 [Glycine max]
MGEAKELFPSVVSACERIFEYFPNCLEFLVGGSKLCYALKKIIVLVMVKGMTPALAPPRYKIFPLCATPPSAFPSLIASIAPRFVRILYYDGVQ